MPASPAGPGPVDECSNKNCARVTIALGGNGSGTATSTPAGINCTLTAGVTSGTCSNRFSWSRFQPFLEIQVDYRAQIGSDLLGGGRSWLSTIRLYPGDDFIAPATDWGFVLRAYSLSVSRSGAGTGKVTSAPGGIDCGSACSKSFGSGTKVALTATPDAGAVFKEWTGFCKGQDATCDLTVEGATSTTAVFELSATGGGTTGGTTGGGTTGGGTAGGAGSESDTAVEAEVIAVKSARSGLGRRVIRVEIAPDETISVTLELVRGGKTLRTKRVGTVRAGSQVVTLLVPGSAGKGRAKLEITLADRAGNEITLTRTVRLGRA